MATKTKTYVVRKGDTGAMADVVNKAQAYLSGGTYKSGQAIDTNYWGNQGGKAAMYGNNTAYKGQAVTTKDYETMAKYAALYDKQQNDAALAAQKKKSDEQYANSSQAIYEKAAASLTNGVNNSNDALRQSRDNQLNALKQGYDDSARDYYRLYRTQQVELPERLSTLGVTGGASESAQLDLMNKYSDNVYRNELARRQANAGVESDYNNQVASNSINLANDLANMYMSAAQADLTYRREQEEAEAAAKAQASVDRWNNSVYPNIAKREAEGYDVNTWTDSDGKIHYRITGNESKKQAEVDNWNNNVYKNIAARKAQGYKVTTWKDSDGKVHYQVSGSTQKKTVNSGRSSRKSSSSASSSTASKSSSSGSSSKTMSYDDVYKNALATKYGNSTYGSKVGGTEDAVKYVQKNSAGLTDAQIKKILNAITK